MSVLILILHLGLFITSGSTESSEDHTRAEADLKLECLNDFLTEMRCCLTLPQLESCSEFSLSLTTDNKIYTSDFKLGSGTCECLLNVTAGFVVRESFRADVLRRKKYLLTTNIDTTESIKPKKPTIVSVDQTELGNFLIVWDTGYKTEEPTFNEQLIPQLLYYVEGSSASEKIVNVSASLERYELIGKNLESNSNYIVRARVNCNLNKRFSDYSEPYMFTTPPSLQDYLKIIIPVICVILIVAIFSFYYFYNKILTEWWEKVPTPKIATSFVKQVPNLLSFQNELSPVQLDSSKLVHVGEKTWPASSLVDVRGENSFNSLGKDGSSADVIYGQTGNESAEETSVENTTHWALAKESQSSDQILMLSKHYKNLKSSSDDCNVEKECGNSSGISNKFYIVSCSDESHDPAINHAISDFNESEGVLPAQAKNPDSTIDIDLEYGPCNGFSGSENTSPTLLTPSSNDIIVVPAYQSFRELECTPPEQAFISSHNDVNLIMDKLIWSKDPQKISPESTLIPVENAYKDFQSLLGNSREQQILTTEPELKRMCGAPLHTVPSIQIDCSYHRV